MTRLLVWHSIEEMEHQSVCDDIYRYLYGEGLKHRLLYFRIFMKVSRMLLAMLKTIMSELSRHSRDPKPGEFKDCMKWMMVSPGMGRSAIRESSKFFLPNFSHWSREREDRLLIALNMGFVYRPERVSFES